MNVLVRKMSKLGLLKVELVFGMVFMAVAMIGLPVSIFCLVPDLLAEPIAWVVVLSGAFFFGFVGWLVFVRPYRIYHKLPEVQLEHDGEFLYIHGKKEAKIPLSELTYVHISADLPFIMQEGFLREILIHLYSEEYGNVSLDIEGFGGYKLRFVPHAKNVESELLDFFNKAMNNT